MTLEEITQLTKAYADVRDILVDRVRALEVELEQIKRRRINGIKSAVRTTADAYSNLHAAIEANPQLFVKPKTATFNGIRVGYKKAKVKVVISNPEQTIKLIRKHLSDMTDALIVTEETVAKDAVQNLSAAELKKIGVDVTNSTDQVYIKATDSEIDKIVDALTKDAEKIETEAA